MAGELRCGRATVQRSLERLVIAGYVEHHPATRSDGGKAAHFYRVVLDPADGVWSEGEGAEMSLAEGGMLTQDGHEMPTHHGHGMPAQDGHGMPTHERASIRTTPVNEPLVNGERGAGARGRKDHEAPQRAPVPSPVWIQRVVEADWQALCEAWPTAAADDLSAARRAFDILPRDQQEEALARVPDFLAWLTNEAKRRHPPALPTYLTDRRWTLLPQSVKAAPARAVAPMPVRPVVQAESREGRAWAVLRRIARKARPEPERDGTITLPRAPTPGLLALAQALPEADWVFIGEQARAQCVAWQNFLLAELKPERMGALLDKRWPHPDRRGFMAPWQWPPGKDGQIGTAPSGS